jgi:hypothetical protein
MSLEYCTTSLVLVKWLGAHAAHILQGNYFQPDKSSNTNSLCRNFRSWLPVNRESDVETMSCSPAISRRASIRAETLHSGEGNDARQHQCLWHQTIWTGRTAVLQVECFGSGVFTVRVRLSHRSVAHLKIRGVSLFLASKLLAAPSRQGGAYAVKHLDDLCKGFLVQYLLFPPPRHCSPSALRSFEASSRRLTREQLLRITEEKFGYVEVTAFTLFAAVTFSGRRHTDIDT